MDRNRYQQPQQNVPRRAVPAPQQAPPMQQRPPSGNPPSHAQQQGPPVLGPETQLKVARVRDNAYIFGNLIKLPISRFPRRSDGLDTFLQVTNLRDGTFSVFSARSDAEAPDFTTDNIGLVGEQRKVLGVELGDTVGVRQFQSNLTCQELASLDLTVGFAVPRKTTTAAYDQTELAMWFHSEHEYQPVSTKQTMISDHNSTPIIFTVGKFTLKDPFNPAAIPHFGILTPNTELTFFRAPDSPINIKAAKGKLAPTSILQSDFKFEDMGIGGLDGEFSTIFRRAFASRIFPPDQVAMLGLQHCKGILLYGPPGTGKTLIARQIGKMLQAKPPKVINGPEVLNKYVGQSEENIRKLFADAEKDYKELGDESGLHIIIFDELDAVCKQRGSGAAGGTGVGDSVVNQLLSKLDGVDQLNNILLIGMTNRMDMIDDALLRPGRLELHIEISLPSEDGRHDIFKIHTATMKKNNKLASDVNFRDLAARTKNFSGAEVVGLIRAATSFAFSRHIDIGSTVSVKKDVDDIEVRGLDFENALGEVKPAYGVSEEALEQCIEGQVFNYSEAINDILRQGNTLVNQVSESPRNRLLSALFWGPPGSGKTALAAKVALDSGFPFIRRISPTEMQGFNDAAKIQHITRVFADAHKSQKSIVLIDSIEKIIDYSRIGPRFSNNVLVALSVAIADSAPPKGRRLLVLATTSRMDALQQLQFDEVFTQRISVPAVNTLEELETLLKLEGSFSDPSERAAVMTSVQEGVNPRRLGSLGVGVKKVLFIIESAKREENPAVAFGWAFSTAVQESVQDEAINSMPPQNGYAAPPRNEPIDIPMKYSQSPNIEVGR